MEVGGVSSGLHNTTRADETALLQRRRARRERELYEGADAEVTPPDGWTPKDPLAGRVLIGKRITGGVEPPAQLIEDFLYAGKVHAVNAEAGEGKTLLALWAVTEVVGQGLPVLYLDAENGPRLIAERLRDMGSDPEGLDRLLHYYQSPDVTLKAGALGNLRETAKMVRSALVVFDSLPDFLSTSGLSENEAGDVTRWFLEVARPFRDMGCAVLVLDHVTKSAEGRGRYARGSGAKLAKVDATWSLAKTKPFDRGTVGEITLKRQKDREACLPESLTFAVGGRGEHDLLFRRCAGVTVEPEENDLLTDAARAALEALEPHTDGLRFGEWEKSSGLTESSFKRARRELLDRGLIKKTGNLYRETEPLIGGPTPAPEDDGPVAPDLEGHAPPLEDL